MTDQPADAASSDGSTADGASTRGAEPRPRELTAGRVAALLVATEALIIIGFAGFYLYELWIGRGLDPLVIIMSVVMMVVFVIALSYTARGLLARHPRAQAPAIAFNFLMVPLGIALFGIAPWWVATVVLAMGVGTVASTFLMGKLES